jgi:hypothetical protein
VRLTTARRELIDEFGHLDHRLRDIRPLLRKRDELRKEIELWLAGEPEGEIILVDGRLFRLHAGQKALESVVDVPAVYRRVGAQKFLTIAKVPLTALRRVVDGETLEKLVSYERTGSRPLEAVRLE